MTEENVLIFYYVSVQSSYLSTPTSSEMVVYQTVQTKLVDSIESGIFTTTMNNQAKLFNNSGLSIASVSLSDFFISPAYTTSVIHTTYPSHLPSIKPSSSPTNKPHSDPSSKPTFSLTSYWKYLLSNELSSRFEYKETKLREIYEELVINSNLIHGGVNDWNKYLFEHLTISVSSAKKIKSVDVLYTGGVPGMIKSWTYNCNNSNIADKIVSSLINSFPIKVLCNNQMWTINTCSNGKLKSALCLNCDNPCVSNKAVIGHPLYYPLQLSFSNESNFMQVFVVEFSSSNTNSSQYQYSLLYTTFILILLIFCIEFSRYWCGISETHRDVNIEQIDSDHTSNNLSSTNIKNKSY